MKNRHGAAWCCMTVKPPAIHFRTDMDSVFWGCLFCKQVEMDKANVWLIPYPCVSPNKGTFSVFSCINSTVSDSTHLFMGFFCPLTAIWGELQPQLFILELLQENHDWLLVDAGLPLARHQQDTHHMLLYPSNQFCSPHGPCGCKGRPALFPFLASQLAYLSSKMCNLPNAVKRNENTLIHRG